MQQLQAIWQQIEAYLSDNISLIAVRDKDQVLPSGTTLKAKTPCGNVKSGTTWQQYQKRIVTKEELWHTMDKYNTTAVAMVGGAISGNLEIIDIDVKFNPGIDATLFSDISHFYPALFAKLRIHRTPSGGYHLLYRVTGGVVPGNLKLAGRIKTDEEKQIDIKNGIKKPQDTVNFLETRGEGGYALLPPSMGYTLHAGASIPVITWEERCSLISLCQSYTQVVKVEKAPVAPKQDNGYYSTNPFEDFNQSTAAEDVLVNDGWAKFSENSTYIYFTRAGRSSVISASFHKERRIFYIWTTSSDVQNQKWFNPATLLAQLKFNGDKSKLHHYLVGEGYGKLSNTAESRLITKLATTNKPLPVNASQQAATALQEARTAVQEQYPHGIFWKIGDEGEITISRERFYQVSRGLGYRLHDDTLVLIDGYKLHKNTEREYFDGLKAYITEEDVDTYEEIVNSYEAFIERHGKFSIGRLEHLETSSILKSTKYISYKFYQNCYVEVDKSGILAHEYNELDGYFIWATDIKPRQFEPMKISQIQESLMWQYLKLATGIKENVFKCIGYLIHDYKDSTDAYMIGLVEECESHKDGGGSGKNMFASFLQYMSSWHFIPGSQVRKDNQFMQSWNGQRILSLTDLPKDFDLLYLKPLTDGQGVWKKLFRDEKMIPIHLMPKMLFSTNYSYRVTDGGLKRRILPIEFTSFFHLSGGVYKHFGKRFPEDWDAHQWTAFDNIMLSSIQEYLKDTNLIPAELSESGWLKQFEIEFKTLNKNFIQENIDEWVGLGKISIPDFNKQYDEFFITNNGNKNYKLTSPQLNLAISSYCAKFGIYFVSDKQKKENGINVRWKLFGKEDTTDDKMPF